MGDWEVKRASWAGEALKKASFFWTPPPCLGCNFSMCTRVNALFLELFSNAVNSVLNANKALKKSTSEIVDWVLSPPPFYDVQKKVFFLKRFFFLN